MKELLDRFVEIELTLSRENGAFSLFALFLREDAVDRWDLIVAAPWVDADRKDALSRITQAIQARFTPEELSQLSRVVLVDLANPAVDAVNRAIRIRHGQGEIRDSNFFGLQIKHAYVITSQPLNINEEVVA